MLWPHGHHARQVVCVSACRGREAEARRRLVTRWTQGLSGPAADPSPVFPPPPQTHRELARPAHAQRRGHGAVHGPAETVSAPGPRGASRGGGRGAAWPPAGAGRGPCGAASLSQRGWHHLLKTRAGLGGRPHSPTLHLSPEAKGPRDVSPVARSFGAGPGPRLPGRCSFFSPLLA